MTDPVIVATTASSSLSGADNAPSKAFDGTSITQWTSNGTSTGWLRAELASAVALTRYGVAGRRDATPNRSPKDWTFEGSNDGSTWTTLDTQSGITWTSGHGQVFTFENTTAYLYYRLNVTANGGDVYLNVPELYLQNGLVVVDASAISSFGGTTPEMATDGSLTTTWNTASGSTGWLQVEAFDAISISGYTVGSWSNSAGVNRAPKDWTFQGSNDGTSWATLDTVTGETGWTSGGERRDFTVADSTPYKYFRINVTANNGDTFLAIAELSLTVGSATPPETHLSGVWGWIA